MKLIIDVISKILLILPMLITIVLSLITIINPSYGIEHFTKVKKEDVDMKVEPTEEYIKTTRIKFTLAFFMGVSSLLLVIFESGLAFLFFVILSGSLLYYLLIQK